MYTIGSISDIIGLSPDTLRYYEKLGLLTDVHRSGGQRRYTQQHVDDLQFIRRAQSMDFRLNEIAQLLKLRSSPIKSRTEVRALAEEKLSAINHRIKTLRKLQKELQGLVDQCHQQGPGACPIIKGLEQTGDQT